MTWIQDKRVNVPWKSTPLHSTKRIAPIRPRHLTVCMQCIQLYWLHLFYRLLECNDMHNSKTPSFPQKVQLKFFIWWCDWCVMGSLQGPSLHDSKSCNTAACYYDWKDIFSLKKSATHPWFYIKCRGKHIG